MDEGLKSELQKQGVFTTSLEELYNWGRKNSVWPLQFGLACCAIEMIATSMARYDLARQGGSVSPLAAAGGFDDRGGNGDEENGCKSCGFTIRWANQKYVIAMGACAISGRPVQAGLQCAQGIDRYIPVDVHIPGCPPRPEALLHAFMTLQEKIGEQQLTGAQRPPHLNADAPSEFPVPRFGEHDLEPAKNPEVWHPPKLVRA
jgi:NADH-quinone oxidoreductase subunit B